MFVSNKRYDIRCVNIINDGSTHLYTKLLPSYPSCYQSVYNVWNPQDRNSYFKYLTCRSRWPMYFTLLFSRSLSIIINLLKREIEWSSSVIYSDKTIISEMIRLLKLYLLKRTSLRIKTFQWKTSRFDKGLPCLDWVHRVCSDMSSSRVISTAKR